MWRRLPTEFGSVVARVPRRLFGIVTETCPPDGRPREGSILNDFNSHTLDYSIMYSDWKLVSRNCQGRTGTTRQCAGTDPVDEHVQTVQSARFGGGHPC
ncbi:hypothetical protein DV706_06495 [Natronorubrum bangense]|uniref:Uncharacterized protein n=1 Tax=Natronorubrum bangense TaxID=61858 RepID=A0A4D6HND0_9EURY|nr:hypothetical protein DV706_06495 [Natronorubrum bangense]